MRDDKVGGLTEQIAASASFLPFASDLTPANRGFLASPAFGVILHFKY